MDEWKREYELLKADHDVLRKKYHQLREELESEWQKRRAAEAARDDWERGYHRVSEMLQSQPTT